MDTLAHDTPSLVSRDAWRAALLYGLEKGWALLRCARLGNYMGSVRVARRGPQNYQLDLAAVQVYY